MRLRRQVYPNDLLSQSLIYTHNLADPPARLLVALKIPAAVAAGAEVVVALVGSAVHICRWWVVAVAQKLRLLVVAVVVAAAVHSQHQPEV